MKMFHWTTGGAALCVPGPVLFQSDPTLEFTHSPFGAWLSMSRVCDETAKLISHVSEKSAASRERHMVPHH